MVAARSPRALAVFGTASDVGKSVVATALCRIFRNAGINVAPYKAQNMSNNSGVTPDGCEIGRAQIVQAEAARVVPSGDMNPVLLKPNSDMGAQVVLQGKVCGTRSARGYFRDTSFWSATAWESLERLLRRYELLVIEGAGSCAEMNLYERDFVNFRTARKAGAPVVLVADIDRGGVFAQVVGTLQVIPPEDRALVKGVIVNRFRGDVELFREGIRLLEEMSGIPVLGLIPYYQDFSIDAEDSVLLASKVDPAVLPRPGKTGVAVIYFPHISNFTDLSPLEHDPGVELHYLRRPRSLDAYRMLVLPGSKNVRYDLQWLFDSGWNASIEAFRKKGGVIVGICGGYQMLGRRIADPFGVEGKPGNSRGLGLLDTETVLERDKRLSNAVGLIADAGGVRARGYEIHMGRTSLPGSCSPLMQVVLRDGEEVPDEKDGAVSADGRVVGTYFHGIFDEPAPRHWFLSLADPAYRAPERPEGGDERYELLAEHFIRNLDLEKLFSLIDKPVWKP